MRSVALWTDAENVQDERLYADDQQRQHLRQVRRGEIFVTGRRQMTSEERLLMSGR
jgi:hypothetical protein